MIWKLEHDGVLSDLGQLTSLLNTAKQYLITDSTWNLLDFAPEMHALTGKNLQFYTAPIAGYATIDGQDGEPGRHPDDPGGHQGEVHRPGTRGAVDEHGEVRREGRARSRRRRPSPWTSTTAGRTAGLATGVSQALVAKGYKAGAVTNASAQSQAAAAGTQVFYGSGASANAAKIAGYFGATAEALPSLPAGHVEVLLGTGATVVPASLAPASTTPQRLRLATSSAGNNGAAGGAVTVGAQAKYGIPCVY